MTNLSAARARLREYVQGEDGQYSPSILRKDIVAVLDALDTYDKTLANVVPPRVYVSPNARCYCDCHEYPGSMPTTDAHPCSICRHVNSHGYIVAGHRSGWVKS